MINCTYVGMRAGVVTAVLPILAGDLPWSPGGLLRCFNIVSDEGTINNASYPSAVCKASLAGCWATTNAAVEALSKMVVAGGETRHWATSVGCGDWPLGIFAGVNQWRFPFVSLLMDPMAAGFGAKATRDGVDTGGQLPIPMGRSPDVEMTEFTMPVMILWRREEGDSGGPGTYRGGVGATMLALPHDTESQMGLVVSGSSRAVAANVGLAGGFPAAARLCSHSVRAT
jgi:N-methylhydantoinase B